MIRRSVIIDTFIEKKMSIDCDIPVSTEAVLPVRLVKNQYFEYLFLSALLA
jgi:hypothetical protein